MKKSCNLVQWEKSGKKLREFVEPGNIISLDILDYFGYDEEAEDNYYQGKEDVGFIHDYNGQYRPTFHTFERKGRHWVYCGECVFREKKEQRSEKAIEKWLANNKR